MDDLASKQGEGEPAPRTSAKSSPGGRESNRAALDAERHITAAAADRANREASANRNRADVRAGRTSRRAADITDTGSRSSVRAGRLFGRMPRPQPPRCISPNRSR